jgi:hypothetical protein
MGRAPNKRTRVGLHAMVLVKVAEVKAAVLAELAGVKVVPEHEIHKVEEKSNE